MNRRSQWQFGITERGTWTWMLTKADGTQLNSEEFATLAACTGDAAQHGYKVRKPEDERRQELQLRVTRALKRQQ
jgi:hypothetical protein